jgi:hypothetical protein
MAKCLAYSGMGVDRGPGARRALRQRQARHAVLFLSGGGAYAHADARRTSVAAAAAWAREAGLAGLVLEAGAAQAHAADVAAARRGPAPLQARRVERAARPGRVECAGSTACEPCCLLAGRLNGARGRRMLCGRRAPSREHVCAAACLHCLPSGTQTTQCYVTEGLRRCTVG